MLTITIVIKTNKRKKIQQCVNLWSLPGKSIDCSTENSVCIYKGFIKTITWAPGAFSVGE